MLSPVFVPVKVKERAFVPVKAIEPVLARFKAPVPDASIAPPLLVIVNKRSVLIAEPVYLSVPPSNTKLLAAFVEAPILLFEPPFARVATDKVPPEMVVTPV